MCIRDSLYRAQVDVDDLPENLKFTYTYCVEKDGKYEREKLYFYKGVKVKDKAHRELELQRLQVQQKGTVFKLTFWIYKYIYTLRTQINTCICTDRQTNRPAYTHARMHTHTHTHTHTHPFVHTCMHTLSLSLCHVCLKVQGRFQWRTWLDPAIHNRICLSWAVCLSLAAQLGRLVTFNETDIGRSPLPPPLLICPSGYYCYAGSLPLLKLCIMLNKQQQRLSDSATVIYHWRLTFLCNSCSF